MGGRRRGFTLVELVAIITILGMLAAIAAPRFFSVGVFQSRGFYDQVISSVRYAQKEAIAQHRYVCVVFGASSVTLSVGASSACGTALTSPTGQSPYSINSTTASFAATPANFYFNPLGQPSFSGAPVAISVSGYATPITVEAETGYVH